MEAVPHDLIEVKRFEREQAREQARQNLQDAKALLTGDVLTAIDALETLLEKAER